MLGSLKRLETAWMRRNVPAGRVPREEDGRSPVCIITGSSEGIGLHLAHEFGSRGHRLLLVARNAVSLESAARDLRNRHGVMVYTAPIDLTEPDYLERLETALQKDQLYADIVVNNAAFGLGGPFAEQEVTRIEELCRLNVEALTVLTRTFLPDMLSRARGGILNVASIGGLMPGPYQAAYYASKAYVLSLTEALAHENTGRGVLICAAAPGPVATRFHARMGAANSFYLKLMRPLAPEKAARIIYSGFVGGRTVIVPGLLPSLSSFGARYTPHALLTPFIGWFLKQRY